MIEIAFERDDYCWNEPLTDEEEDACFNFGVNLSQEKRLLAICENIIANNGEFIP